MRALNYEVIPVKTILPQVGKTTVDGAAVDLAGYEGCELVAEIGNSGDTLGAEVYMTIKFQDSDNGSDFGNISSGNLIGGDNDVVINDGDNDSVVVYRGYIGGKRYVRVEVAFTGSHSNGTPVSAVVLKGLPRHAG